MTPSDTESSATLAQPNKRQRIAKLMARAGLCSRRDAEAWIVAGRVSVNGELLTSPALDVADEDQILVDGAPLPALEKTRLFLFHKPRGLVTSDHDPEGRATVADFLRENWPDGPRTVTVGRLDINTEGLLLLTNDGGLARVLELPQTGWVRRYRVRAKGTANPAALDALAAGISIDGVDYAGIEAKLDRTQGANVWLTMGLREGKNREIKRVLEHLGLEVNRLIRLSFGPFQLLELAEGAVEEVRTRVLRDQLGAKLAAQAGVDFGEAPPAEPTRTPLVKAAERKAGDRKLTDRKPADRKHADAAMRRDDKPARAERGTRAPGSRPGDRQGMRREPTEASPVRGRPVRGTRKHVSTLRAERAGSAGDAPRTRIERSDTLDRRNRTVTVERLVRPQAEAPTARKPRSVREVPRSEESRRPFTRPPGRARPGEVERDGRGRRPPGAARPERDGGPRRHPDGAKPSGGPRRHASPSAEGKRERVARSGPRRTEDIGERPARRGPSAAKRSAGAAADRPPRRPDRTEQSRSEQGRPERGRTERRPEGRPDRRAGPRADDRRPDRSPDRTARPASAKARPSRLESAGGRPARSDNRSGPRSTRPARTGAPGGRPRGKPSGGRPRGPQKPKR